MNTQTLNRLCQHTLISHLGIKFTAITENTITATMPVNEKTRQPFNFLHGGASLALAETLASAGSVVLLQNTDKAVFGVSVSAQHTNAAKTGAAVTGIATIIKQGNSLHTWEVKIYDKNNSLISNCMVTNAIVNNNINQ